MIKIKRFIECLIPVTACNLKCNYCYIIQRDKRQMDIPNLKYPINQIKKALTIERFGGRCYFSICGAGETLIPDYVINIVKAILENGHFVNITTNGTLNQRFDELCNLEEDLRRRLNISFSFHYLELLRVNKLDDFFNNINKIKEKGISFVLQLNLCDEYMPYIEEIKEICKKRVGAFPQIAATRKEKSKLKKIELLTEKTEEEYIEIGKQFSSPLFDFTMENFNKKRKEFCYAGDWSFVLNLQTGMLNKCYTVPLGQNIFEDINAPIKFEAVGKNCPSEFCFNSSHFISFGVIPELNVPTYGELRNRKEANWYQSEEIKQAFNSRLVESNTEYGRLKKIRINLKNKMLYKSINLYRKLRRNSNGRK